MKRLLLALLLAGCGSDSTSTDGGDGGACLPTRITARRDIEAVSIGGGKAIVFGGDQSPVQSMTTNPSRQLVDDTWQIDTSCGGWTQLAVTGTPGPRGGYAMAFDSKRNRLVLFGGLKGAGAHPPANNETWSLDLGTMTWSQLSPTGTVPPARLEARMSYDADNDRMLLFGGTANITGLDGPGLVDLEELSFSGSPDGAWSQLSNGGAGAPTDGWAPAMTIDPTRKLLLVFGGARSFLSFSNDLFAFDLGANAWHKVTPGADTPSQRLDARLAYDPPSDSLWIFGGHDLNATGTLNDTWSASLDAAGANVTWTQRLSGDTALSIQGVDHNSPERRERHGLFLDEHKLWTVLGGSDCAPLDDAWWLDLSAPTAWTVADAPQVGQTCYRLAMPGQQCPTSVTAECTAPF
jgi:hypothetical protein